MTPLGRPPVMLDIVEAHFEERDFHRELREGVIFAPDWTLDELADLEERAEAHLDGLRLAELHAVDVARPHLTGEHTFGATAATFVFMETGEAELISEVIAALESADAPARDGIRIGLRHSKIDAIEKRLFELAASAAPPLRAAAADVLTFHRRAQPDIRGILTDEDDTVRILAFGALGRGGAPLDSALVTAGLLSKAPEVRRAVLEAAARSGTRGLDRICGQAASATPEADTEALAFLGVLGDPRSLAFLQEALRRPEHAVAAVRGLGALGRIEAIPVLIHAMEKPELAPAASAAFMRITGATDIVGPRPPVNLSSGDSIGDEFADDTPPPVPAKALAWWESKKRAFNPARRWQAGGEVSAGPLGPSFHTLPLVVRRDIYLGGRAGGESLPDLEFELRAVRQRSG